MSLTACVENLEEHIFTFEFSFIRILQQLNNFDFTPVFTKFLCYQIASVSC